MFERLPSLLRFQPRFFTGGPTRFYLPLFYDLVANRKPKTIAVLGFGDGQAFFTFCQAVREQRLACTCVALRPSRPNESADGDRAWQKGKAAGQEFYGDFACFLESDADLSGIDLLLIDDCDSAAELRNSFAQLEAKLAGTALVLFHGLDLEREENLHATWHNCIAPFQITELHQGIGLGTATRKTAPLRDLLGNNLDLQELTQIYQLALSRIENQARADAAERAQFSLESRQVWLDSMFADRMQAQKVMDEQAGKISYLEQRFEPLQRDREKAQLIIEEQVRDRAKAQIVMDAIAEDRAKAQLVMDEQAEHLKRWAANSEQLSAERDRLKAQVKEQKEILKFAKQVCRKKGRCFPVPGSATEKIRRPVSERIMREISRMPRNLFGRKKPASEPAIAPSVSQLVRPKEQDRYEVWITGHEPNETELRRQKSEAQAWPQHPKISLLLPVLDTPENFLDEMISSVVAQTYDNWELCIVDAASTKPEMISALENWRARESRIRFERLSKNFGVAENTNRALQLATGDLITCIDHDDLLAPFALHELALTAIENSEAEIFYSDEDRLTSEGKRHSPFFKPDWSPEYLLSSMYLGHLTAYRRELVERVGKFRSEFDLSQDYDFALRATEIARAVVHIPHVLYHWREHAASGSAGGKPHARQTNLAALADAMQRRGLDADVLEYPSANRVRYKISEWPRVSIIVPTDSASRARAAVEQLPKETEYPDLEIVVVTNSALADPLETTAPKVPQFQFVRYDQLFNFSDKCNEGARAATGEIVIFFNDDVESGQADWIQNLIEPLANPEIGAVAPKLLYATGKIQHAGLVTGVRGLVGTACHQWPGNSTDYANFAQSMRDVSALSAACLAMRREDFFRVGEFDVLNTPIAHSDLDLSFKVRAAGMRCVYTPFATMKHRGHESIGVVEREEKKRAPEKVSSFMLKRWAEYTCRDPYFPDNLRDWLYADSPTPIRMWARDDVENAARKPDLLFVSHDLTWSGAPLILLHSAKWLRARGFFITLMSPADGPLREEFVAAGIPVIVDPLITTGHPSFIEFARDFDCVVASTIFSAPIIRAAKSAGIPHLWWIHEGRVAEHYLQTDPQIRAALAQADLIVTPDTRSSLVYQPYAQRKLRILNYGIPDPREKFEQRPREKNAPLKFLLLGTIEQRKGQQVLLAALRRLPNELLAKTEFQIVGRPHDLAITEEVKAAAKQFPFLIYRDGVSPNDALRLIRDTDVMLCASADETGPLILMEALALGKAIVSSRSGGVAENLDGGNAGIFFKIGDAAALAQAIENLIRDPELLERQQQNARPAFDKYFAFDRFGDAFEKIVREAVASRNEILN